MKLYVYEHCPFCAKARMIFGLKGVPFELIVLANDDEATPMRMIGQKMLPILEKEDGSYVAESMDIVHYVDGLTGTTLVTPGGDNPQLTAWLEKSREYAMPLGLPRYVEAPLKEFSSDKARQYFKKKKELQFGSFTRHLAETARLIPRAHTQLALLEPMIASPDAVHGELSEDDFHLYTTLRALSIVKGLKFPDRVEQYRQVMAAKSGVPLFDAVAR